MWNSPDGRCGAAAYSVDNACAAESAFNSLDEGRVWTAHAQLNPRADLDSANPTAMIMMLGMFQESVVQVGQARLFTEPWPHRRTEFQQYVALLRSFFTCCPWL